MYESYIEEMSMIFHHIDRKGAGSIKKDDLVSVVRKLGKSSSCNMRYS